VPGVTIDRQCGSSQQSVHFAAQAVMSGTSDLVVAGGVQNMSQIPISYAMTCAEPLGFTDPFSGSKGWVDRYGTQEVSQFRGAEMVADKWNISREDMERFALESHERALRATAEGRFAREIAPIAGVSRGRGPAQDEPREDGDAAAPAGRAEADRRDGEPDLGRRVVRAGGVGARGEGPRPRAARARAPHQRARRTTRSTCSRRRSRRCATRSRRRA
jgi:acetyl-CoA C-acetyltransferase